MARYHTRPARPRCISGAVAESAFYFLALLNPRDRYHRAAVISSEELQGKLITTQYVLIEVADALASPAW